MNDTRQVATMVIVAAIIGIVFYAAGYGHAASRATHKEQQLVNAARMQQAKLLAIKSRADLLGARVALYQAEGDVGREDPAMANDHIEEALSDLAAVNASEANVDAGRLSNVQNQLRSFQVSGTADPDAQRSQIKEFGEELDKLISTPAAVPANR
ncbi:MAG: hypothetical protein ACYDHY_14760 [Acidiferrobacterales bacterium]